MNKNLKNEETKGVITFKGNPFTLLGNRIKVGDKAPEEVVLIDQTLAPVKLSDFKGKKVIISTFPSVDTGVCALQTKTFNKIASELGDDIVILNVSRDLPFALGRFCAAEGLKNAITLSDYREGEFGLEMGLLMKELMLLARGVTILDKDGKVVYQEIVKEQTNEPDYNKALEAVKNIK